MLTPSFDVSQTDEFVIIVLRVPYVKISEAEIYFEGSKFKFYCKPYFLHLHLPGQLSQQDAGDGHERASYDIETGTLTVHLSKLNHGEHFANLEMLTTLLPSKRKDLKTLGEKPSIEVLEPGTDGAAVGGASEEEEEEFDWEVEQNCPSDPDSCLEVLSGLSPYGFALQYKGVFLKLQEEIPSIVDCPDPDHMTPQERRIGRIANEEASFNQDHYLADLMDNDYIHILTSFQPPWQPQLAKWKEKKAASKVGVHEPGPDIISFTASQQEKLKSLQNREYILDKATKKALLLGLVDIIFAYAYNFRSTEGEGSVESAWTICKVSSTLSWLEAFHGKLREVVYCCLRRSLCYPLYRHWKLSLSVLQDTRDLFRLGRRKLLQCVLDIRDTLNNSEPYYILNNLYITDYAIWLQSASVKQIQNLAGKLEEVNVECGSLGWGLVELEEAALLTAREVKREAKGSPEHVEAAGPVVIVPPTHQGGGISSQLQMLQLNVSEEREDKPLIEELTTPETQKEPQTMFSETGSESSSETDGETTSSEAETESENGSISENF